MVGVSVFDSGDDSLDAPSLDSCADADGALSRRDSSDGTGACSSKSCFGASPARYPPIHHAAAPAAASPKINHQYQAAVRRFMSPRGKAAARRSSIAFSLAGSGSGKRSKAAAIRRPIRASSVNRSSVIVNPTVRAASSTRPHSAAVSSLPVVPAPAPPPCATVLSNNA